MCNNETFLKAFCYVLKNEGGYVDDPDDSGGATKYGISLQFLKNCFKNGSIYADINSDGKIDKNDIIEMDLGKARYLYYQEFWTSVNSIPDDDIAIKVFDTAVNIGTGNAIKLLQKALGVEKDGILGPITINAIKKGNKNKILMDFVEALSCHYYKIAFWNRPKSEKYIRGWIARAKRLP